MNYTHEVWSPSSGNLDTTHYYHQPSKCVYNLEHVLVNDNWEVINPRYWDIRPIVFTLENE